jgi:short-subunit dehydrogenase
LDAAGVARVGECLTFDTRITFNQDRRIHRVSTGKGNPGLGPLETELAVMYQPTNLTVVTGASSGIGTEIARRLAARGARLLLTGRDVERLRMVADSLDPAAPAAEVMVADLADPAGVEAVVAAIGDRPVDLLVNNAGFATFGPHAGLDPRVETKVLAVNCTAVVALTRAVLPGMLERRRGFVLNIASTIAFQPAPGQATYGASKAFVLSYSEALAEELRDTSVRVAVLCPGPTETAFLSRTGRPEEAATSAVYRRHGSAARVAAQAMRMLDGHRVVLVVGWMNSVVAQAGRLTPRPLMRRISGRLLRPHPAPITRRPAPKLGGTS